MEGLSASINGSTHLPAVTGEEGTPFSREVVRLTKQEAIQLKWQTGYWKALHDRLVVHGAERENELKLSVAEDRFPIQAVAPWRAKQPLTAGLIAQWLRIEFTGLPFRDGFDRKSQKFSFPEQRGDPRLRLQPSRQRLRRCLRQRVANRTYPLCHLMSYKRETRERLNACDP